MSGHRNTGAVYLNADRRRSLAQVQCQQFSYSRPSSYFY